MQGLLINDTFSDLSGNSLALTTNPQFVSANLGSAEGTLLTGEKARGVQAARGGGERNDSFVGERAGTL